MEWLTHIGVFVGGGGLASLVGLIFWSWSKKNSIQAQEEKDKYEMEKIRKSDAYKELLTIIAELKSNSALQDKRIQTLFDEHVDCHRKSAMQEVQIYKQVGIIQFLETRVKNLEAALLPATSSVMNSVISAAIDLQQISQEANAKKIEALKTNEIENSAKIAATQEDVAKLQNAAKS